jgi:ferrochelatase
VGVRPDSVLLVSFGGPEAPEQVLPFLRHVTAGRGIPDERLEVVGAHYAHFGGVSPINAQARALREALAQRLDLPVVLAHRHVPPYLEGGLDELRMLGAQRSLVLLSSAFPSPSGCRSYRDELERCAATHAPDVQFDVLPKYGIEPGFTIAFADGLREALTPGCAVLFTAHSIPVAQARLCDYEQWLHRAADQVCTQAGYDGPWEIVWQSRSGPPGVPWLEPDVGDRVAGLAAARTRETAQAPAEPAPLEVVVVPIGFISDHIEIHWDLDTELAARCTQLGVRLSRVATPGTDPRFVEVLVRLVQDRLGQPPEISSPPGCPGGLSCCRPPAGAPTARGH